MMSETTETETEGIDNGGPGAETGRTEDTGAEDIPLAEKGDILQAETETGDTERIGRGQRRQDKGGRRRRKRTCPQHTNPSL